MAVNGEDVKDAPRDHVIQLVRSCETQVNLLVCQPEMLPFSPGRKSTLLSPARKEKLRNKRPSRVRFAESVSVNGAPLFPVSFIASCQRVHFSVLIRSKLQNTDYIFVLVDSMANQISFYTHWKKASGWHWKIRWTHDES